jgi:phospholipid/cholesterol/gamma-HCH transport system permease protein
MATKAQPGWCRTEREGQGWAVLVGGRWTLDAVESLAMQLSVVNLTGPAAARLDLSAVEALDTAGAWILYRLARRLEHTGLTVQLTGATPAQHALLERMALPPERAALARPGVGPLRALVERAGESTIENMGEARDLLGFFGLTIVTLLRTLMNPTRLRFTAFVVHLERIGINALPIVGLLSFLIGVVLAFQGADQLRQFGAEIFTVNLLGVSVLREIGILMTAIMVAGRSGSAFTAEIGTMKVNEEVDAMTVLGLDPMEVLVLPRLLALMVALPLLGFYADMMGLLGGAIMTVMVLDISVPQFVTQLQNAVTLNTLMVGLVKAPVFAFLIGMVGCYEGLKVEGSAESVGRMTTTSVVESIFLVIVADAIFSIIFSSLGI